MATSFIGSIFVTGCSRGIGLTIVKKLLNQPVQPKHVIATCRSLDGAQELAQLAAKHANLHLLQFDVTATSRLPEIVKQVGKIVGDDGLTMLINNAGIFPRLALEEVDVESMMKAFEVNAVAPLMTTKHFLPLLRKAATASSPSVVVNFSSLMGSISDNTSGRCYAYRSSKAALNMVTKSLSVDLAKDHILAVPFHPGWVITDMGGSGGKTTQEESVDGLFKIIRSLTAESSGTFINFAGKIMPW